MDVEVDCEEEHGPEEEPGCKDGSVIVPKAVPPPPPAPDPAPSPAVAMALNAAAMAQRARHMHDNPSPERRRLVSDDWLSQGQASPAPHFEALSPRSAALELPLHAAFEIYPGSNSTPEKRRLDPHHPSITPPSKRSNVHGFPSDTTSPHRAAASIFAAQSGSALPAQAQPTPPRGRTVSGVQRKALAIEQAALKEKTQSLQAAATITPQRRQGVPGLGPAPAHRDVGGGVYSSIHAPSRPEETAPGPIKHLVPQPSQPTHLLSALAPLPLSGLSQPSAPAATNNPPSAKPSNPSDAAKSLSQKKKTTAVKPSEEKPEKRADRYNLTLKRREELGINESTIRAFSTHLDIMMAIYNQNSIPPSPTAAELQDFEQRFSTKMSLTRGGIFKVAGEVERIAQTLFQEFTASVTCVPRNSRSQIQRDMADVPEHTVRNIFFLLARFGLRKWAPDTGADPTTNYNMALRAIAIRSFMETCTAFGYVHIGPVMSEVTNLVKLNVIFEHIIFHKFKKRVIKESNNPGALQQTTVSRTESKQRQRLGKGRTEYLTESGWPSWSTGVLADEHANSDDEAAYDPILKQHVLYRLPKEGRSAFVTELAVEVDHRRSKEKFKNSKKFAGFCNRILLPADGSVITKANSSDPTPPGWIKNLRKIAQPPSNKKPRLPIDYFDHNYFNQQSVAFRAWYMYSNFCAFPDHINVLDLLDGEAGVHWKKQSLQTFMEYGGGREKLAKYHFPTNNELKALLGKGEQMVYPEMSAATTELLAMFDMFGEDEASTTDEMEYDDGDK
jgi:hypothetical protein